MKTVQSDDEYGFLQNCLATERATFLTLSAITKSLKTHRNN